MYVHILVNQSSLKSRYSERSFAHKTQFDFNITFVVENFDVSLNLLLSKIHILNKKPFRVYQNDIMNNFAVNECCYKGLDCNTFRLFSILSLHFHPFQYVIPYEFYVLGQIGLRKQCRPISDCF